MAGFVAATNELVEFLLAFTASPVFTNGVASLVAKYVQGKRYWQLVTSQRVGGKPRQVVLAHLGTADQLLARLEASQGKAIKAQVLDFGLLAAGLRVARELELVELIDAHVPKRRQGPSLGQYMLLAALNRLSSPTSKAQMADWYQATALQRLMPVPVKALSSQRFWDHMEALDRNTMAAIEAELSRRLVERYQIDLSCLCFDCTNFDTFINTENPAELPQRGHAKSKRSDLRVVGLALLVSSDFNIPLFSEVYPGNQADSVTFASVTERLVERYRLLAQDLEHVTLVLDKGNNSKKNLNELAQSPYYVVGSLVPSQHKDLLEVPLSQFQSFSEPRLEGTTAFRTTRKLFGSSWTIVVTRSQELLRGQLRGINQQLKKRRQELDELQRKLKASQRPGAKGKAYTRQSLQKHAQRLSQGQYIQELLKIEVSEHEGHLSLSYRTDHSAFNRLIRTTLGKRILFTNNHDWSTEGIILAYRSQYHVEAAFEQMKDPFCVAWEPMHHWTDQKIRVHAFYCLLALTLFGLMHRKVRQAGIHIGSDQLRRDLSKLKEVVNLYPSQHEKAAGRPKAETTYSEISEQTKHLVEALDVTSLQV